MILFAEAIKKAEAISTRKEKHAALSGFGPEEKQLLFETYNPFRVFNVKKWDQPQAFSSDDGNLLEFFRLLEALHSRRLTGNAAREAVTRTLSYYTAETAKYLERVIKKDLKCGASRDTFEALYPDLKIPKFDIMLAAKIDEIAEETDVSKREGKVVLTENLLKSKYGLSLPVIAEAKYDGNRLIAFVTNGKVEYYSRSGKDSDHLIGIFDAELIAMEKTIGQPIVIDGEVLGDSFQETMKAKGEKGTEEKAGLKFYAFDYMTRVEWDLKSNPYPQSFRSTILENLLAQLGTTKVVKSKYKICNSIQELRDFYAEVLHEGINPDGSLNGLGEGLIVKNFTGLYEWERSNRVVDRKTKQVVKPYNWLKWKPVIDLDLKLVGFEHGTKGTRLEKTVGRVILEGTDENGRKIQARCGSGLDDKMRDYILKNISSLLDSTVHIEAQELSLAQNSDVWSARFPIFIKFRSDK